MATPSRKTIRQAFPRLTDEQVEQVKYEMVRADDADYWSRGKAVRQAMRTIDLVLETHGVEGIPQGHNSKSPAITYCNTGDPYMPTVMYLESQRHVSGGSFHVGCWGDIVERGNYD